MSHWIFTAAVLVNLVAGASQSRAATDSVPKFDIERGCRLELAAGSPIGETMASCRADEQRARDAVALRWSSFSQTDRTLCTKETQIDGSPSYVELEICLEMTPSGQQSR